MEKISRIKAIKTFFESDGGKKCTMEELKNLNDKEKDELGRLCAKALGKEMEEKK